MPDEQQLPPGPRRDLVAALHDLYELAGKPAARAISAWIRERDDLPGTLSHEGVSAALRGSGTTRWANLESLVCVLVEKQRVGEAKVGSVVARIHTLWRIADGGMAPEPVGEPELTPQSQREAIASLNHPRLGIVEFRDRQTVVDIFREAGGLDEQP
ncbi:hypothetical protein [Nonomuraea rhizosphaerae]|uniref:hypothetical protein n=1 Tax=Nonomuraea rhizosphaerae TaxID=2665663 RepID=UPI001C5E0595|nr:hypothetical protein [Nonomuraea rhizosphaerae]